jgi:primary-amine oxidase
VTKENNCSSDMFPRYAEVISCSLEKNEVFIDYISLTEPNGYSSTTDSSNSSGLASVVLSNVQTGLSPTEYVFVEKVCKEYEPLRKAIADRGLDPAFIVADAWCVGYLGEEYDPKEKICWPSLFYFNPNVDDLPYTRPIEGIDIRISLTKKEIISFDDSTFHQFPIPQSNETVAHYIKAENKRKDLKPIYIIQPEGPSWKILKSTMIDWQKWSFHIGFNGKEGATIHGICYEGRPILHRMSIAEMVVPYGDPRAPHSLKNAFDAGEDGFGRNANSLKLGCDCLGVIHYIDGNVVNDDGNVRIIENAICLHEEDYSIAWKHTGS